MWRAQAWMASARSSGCCQGEGHALGELSQHRGIDGIGLGAGLHASVKRLAALGLITMRASPALSRARAR